MANDKILDLETMEMVEKPAEKQPEIETKTEEKKDDNPSDVKDEVDDVEAKKEEEGAEEKTDDGAEGKEEVKEEEKVDAPVAEKKDEEEDVVLEIDTYLKDNYGIADEDTLRATLQAADDIAKQNDELTKEIADLKAAKREPEFASDDEKKAFEFIKKFPVEKFSEGLQTYGRLITMDLEKAEPRILLEEKFIIEHPELTREEALRKFGRDFSKKYSVKVEDYDSEAVYKEEQEDRNIDMKSDAAKARKFLQKQQEEFKAKPADKEQDQKETVNPVIETNIRENVAELDTYMKDFTEIVFAPSERKEEEFTYKLTKEQRQQVHEGIKSWIGNPATYGKDGKIVGGYEVEEKAVAVAQLLFGEAMIEKAYKAGLTQGQIKRVDQISTQKPTRTSKASDGKLPSGNDMDQFERQAKAKALERSKRPPVAQ